MTLGILGGSGHGTETRLEPFRNSWGASWDSANATRTTRFSNRLGLLRCHVMRRKGIACEPSQELVPVRRTARPATALAAQAEPQAPPSGRRPHRRTLRRPWTPGRRRVGGKRMRGRAGKISVFSWKVSPWIEFGLARVFAVNLM